MLPVSRSAFRPVYGSQGLYKSVSARYGQASVQGRYTSSLLRRYSHKSSIKRATCPRSGHGGDRTQEPRVHHQSRQISVDTVTGYCLSRGQISDLLKPGVPVGSKEVVPEKHGFKVPTGKEVYGQTVVSPSRQVSVHKRLGQERTVILSADPVVHGRPLQASSAKPPKPNPGHPTSVRTHKVVDHSKQPGPEFAPLFKSTLGCDHHRCIWQWLGGGAQPHFHGPRSLGGTSTQLAHQQPRDAGGDSDVASLCEQTVGSSSSGQIRQHDSLQLSQQSGRNAVGFPLPTDSQVMELGIGPSLGVEGSLSPRGSQPASRRIVQTEKDASPSGERAGRQGVEFERSSSGGNFSPVRSPSGGSVCDKVQQEAPSVCVAGTRRRRVRSRRNVNLLGSPLWVRFALSCAVAEDTRQDKEGEGDHPIDSSQMAPEGMVLRSSAAINRDTVGVTSTTGSPFAERQVSSKSAIPEAHGLETKRQQLLDQGLSEKSADIVMAAKSESTRTVYSKQWDSFCDWCSQSGFNPMQANVNQIVSFLEHLFYEDRKPATIKTYCSAISFFRGRIEGMTLLSIPIVKNWLQGISRLRPTTKVLCPSWDLALVLNALMEAPYEPAQSATLTAWTHKTVFLIAVTSAARVSEIQALDCRPHLSIIRRNTAILRTDPMFIPKVNSQGNRDREIFLEGFFPSPKTRQERHWHTVCPVRALKYYLEKTKDLRKPDCNRIFVATSGRSVGSSVKTCTISSWIRHTIQNAYEHMGRDPPAVRAHSVRGMATSLALSKGICVQDICRAATWSSEHVFVKHYKLDVLPASAASLSNAVLSSGIQK